MNTQFRMFSALASDFQQCLQILCNDSTNAFQSQTCRPSESLMTSSEQWRIEEGQRADVVVVVAAAGIVVVAAAIVVAVVAAVVMVVAEMVLVAGWWRQRWWGRCGSGGTGGGANVVVVVEATVGVAEVVVAMVTLAVMVAAFKVVMVTVADQNSREIEQVNFAVVRQNFIEILWCRKRCGKPM